MVWTGGTSEQNHHYPELIWSRQPHQIRICSPLLMMRLSTSIYCYSDAGQVAMRLLFPLNVFTLSVKSKLRELTCTHKCVFFYTLCRNGATLGRNDELHFDSRQNVNFHHTVRMWLKLSPTDGFKCITFTWLYQSMNVDHPIMLEQISSCSCMDLIFWPFDVWVLLALICAPFSIFND